MAPLVLARDAGVARGRRDGVRPVCAAQLSPPAGQRRRRSGGAGGNPDAGGAGAVPAGRLAFSSAGSPTGHSWLHRGRWIQPIGRTWLTLEPLGPATWSSNVEDKATWWTVPEPPRPRASGAAS